MSCRLYQGVPFLTPAGSRYSGTPKPALGKRLAFMTGS